ncbi:MAG: hypothetical protein ABI340_09185 [Nitrososphaera sp.]|jgi:hypothetical protein
MAFKESIISWHIKIVSAIPGLARTLTEQKVRKFLNSRLNLQLGTVDEKGVCPTYRIAEKIITKYMGGLDNDLARWILNEIRQGNEAVLEITPKYYSAWSFA